MRETKITKTQKMDFSKRKNKQNLNTVYETFREKKLWSKKSSEKDTNKQSQGNKNEPFYIFGMRDSLKNRVSDMKEMIQNKKKENGFVDDPNVVGIDFANKNKKVKVNANKDILGIFTKTIKLKTEKRPKVNLSIQKNYFLNRTI